jgi:hypothetical protein
MFSLGQLLDLSSRGSDLVNVAGWMGRLAAQPCVFSNKSTLEFLELSRSRQAPQFSTHSRCDSCPKTTAAYHGTSVAVELVDVKHLSDDCPVPLEGGHLGHRQETVMAIN